MLDFLAYLEFERGLSRNTLDAYRSDLQQFGAHLEKTGRDALAVAPPTSRRSSPRSTRGRATARRSRPRPCSARSPACAPSTATCAAASRSPRTRPRSCTPRARTASSRRCSRARRSRRCSSSPSGQEPAALRDRALLEIMYACGLRASEATGARGRRRRPRVRDPARPRQGLQGAPRPGRLDRRPRAGGLPAARAPQARRRPPGAVPVPQPPRRRPDPPGALQDRPAPRPLRRPGLEDEPAHAAAHVRHPPAGRRLRPAQPAGDARPRRHRHDAALHARLRGPPDPKGPRIAA